MRLSPHLYRFEDTCNVYAVLDGSEAVLVDFGDGGILDWLAELGVTRVTDVLMTHHHRDQGQGLARAVEAGARVWVPHAEQELFAGVDAFWQARQLANSYNVRQDRFSLLEPVAVAGTLQDYAAYRFGSREFTVLPTPGHTPGSFSLLAEIDGQRLAFTGDLIAAPGKVWSLAASQWTYNGAEGAAASIASLLDLKDTGRDVLLPSHGEPICTPGPAIELLVSRLADLLAFRREHGRLFDLHSRPYERITPHLLLNRTSMANSYLLLSESGKALVIDFGYDFVTGETGGTERAARRPWLHTLPVLKRDFAVSQIDVAIPTHYHDDHVAGLDLLRRVEGTRVWAADTFAGILEDPTGCDLPCLWHDPVPVDRRLPLETPFSWEEYELCLYPLGGHTRYAVAVSFMVDGVRVLATGDQDIFDPFPRWNYVYRNRFEPDGYRLSAALYARLLPDLLLTGHWGPQPLLPEHLARLQEGGEALDRLHRELLPDEIAGFGAEGAGVRIHPYDVTAHGGERVELAAEVRNPSPTFEDAILRPVVPPGWQVEETEIRLALAPCETVWVKFYVTPPVGSAVRRARLAVDLTVGGRRFGQQAEALVTVLYPDLGPASVPALVPPGPAAAPTHTAPHPYRPAFDRDFPDPRVLKSGGVYYAYATNSSGIHVQAARSMDLLHWESLPDALPELPSWAVQKFGYTWSPDVSIPASGGGFRLYYVTRLARRGRGVQAIGVASGARLGGPFSSSLSRPLVCQIDQGGSIDPHVFTNVDGARYLVWKNDGNSIGAPTWIYLQRLSDDGLHLLGEPFPLITADQPWEGSIIEGPALWQRDGCYYLFYSANSYTCERYAIGCAAASSLFGPYRKLPGPLLYSDPAAGLLGPGGQDIVLAPNGETWMLFHAWRPGRYRAMYAARVEWEDGNPVVGVIGDR